MSKIKAKLVRIFDVQGGISKTGNEWKKLPLLFEETENTQNYPRTIYTTVFGESRIGEILPKLRIGAEYELTFDIESREFNGRWYTDVNVWKAEPVGVAAQPAAAPAPVAAPAAAPQQQRMQFTDAPAGGADDLPF